MNHFARENMQGRRAQSDYLRAREARVVHALRMFTGRGARECLAPFGDCKLKSIARGIAHASACVCLRRFENADILSADYGLNEIIGETAPIRRSKQCCKKLQVPLGPRKLPEVKKQTQNASAPRNDVFREKLGEKKSGEKITKKLGREKDIKGRLRKKGFLRNRYSLTRDRRRSNKPSKLRQRRIAKRLQHKTNDEIKAVCAAMMLFDGHPNQASQNDETGHSAQVTASSKHSATNAAQSTQVADVPQSMAAVARIKTPTNVSGTTCIASGCEAAASAPLRNTLSTSASVVPSEGQHLLGGNPTLNKNQDSISNVRSNFFREPATGKPHTAEGKLAVVIFIEMCMDPDSWKELPRIQPLLSMPSKCVAYFAAAHPKFWDDILASLVNFRSTADNYKNSPLWNAFQDSILWDFNTFKKQTECSQDVKQIIYFDPQASKPSGFFFSKRRFPDGREFCLKSVIVTERGNVLWARYVLNKAPATTLSSKNPGKPYSLWTGPTMGLQSGGSTTESQAPRRTYVAAVRGHSSCSNSHANARPCRLGYTPNSSEVLCISVLARVRYNESEL